MVKSTYDSDLRCANLLAHTLGYRKPIYEHYLRQSYDCTQEKPCALRKMFSKLDVSCKSIVTLTLS